MARLFQRIREAAIDGRTQNVYYRQSQLERLRDVLVQNEEALQQAIVKDSGNSVTEAKIEYSLALLALKDQYASLNPAAALEEEYAISHGKDAPQRTEGAGIVNIVPTAYTLLYSVITPLCAAIAAGNCVILELEQTPRDLPSLLRKLLGAALDVDTFEIAPSRAADPEFRAQCIEVLQEGSQDVPKYTQLVSPSQARVVAVVDRTANLEEAAKALVTARFSFGGKSPYAPDVVLVNEFAKKEFMTAVVKESIDFLTTENGSVEKGGVRRKPQGKKLLDEVRDSDLARIVTSGANGAILDVEKRDSDILQRKINECCLAVHSVKSLDDAIDFANRNGDLLASYTFATPAAAKYLSQFLHSYVSFVNHVPMEMLVGPAAPLNHPVSPSTRYPASLFAVPRPQYVTPSPRSALIKQTLPNASSVALTQLLEEARADLPIDKKRPERVAVGFFEQGIITGLSFVLVSTLAGLGTLGYFGTRMVRTRFL
ncbi:hypothetical protein H2201_004327 [Coniosporium apollinis]|uniref:Aldehyde dehydrogenase domain-containing protein n=1 Tax=Coniosporium apollinis TaxID=61459 RepID=A0ABQ9NWC8_9PEZI|nr:hypothetical protein H2201_004327 [Coniosporium apollinis]